MTSPGRRPGLLPAATAVFCISGAASTAGAPPPAPSVSAIKACIRQIDVGDKWHFAWRRVEIGSPRHPRNSYEALYAPAGSGGDDLYGYPVHVVFSMNGRADIDAVYWLVRDRTGHWQIPAICTMR